MPLKISMVVPFKGVDGHADLWGLDAGKKASFWLKKGTPCPDAIHWGLDADNNKDVDAFYETAMASGAKDRISPRTCLEYYPGYYAADIIDPDGYHFEVIRKSKSI